MEDKIVSEEKNLAFSTNLKNTILNIIVGLTEITILILIILKTFKYIKEYGKIFSHDPIKKIKYSRELPFNGITPGQAAFIKDINFFKMGDVFGAALLNMKFKGIIDITYSGEKNNVDDAFIKILDIKPELDVEEKPVFDFLVNCLEKFQKTDLSISLKMLSKYIAHSTEGVSNLKKQMKEIIKVSIPSYDPKADKTVTKRIKAIVIYIITFVLTILISGNTFDLFTLISWIGIISLINLAFCIGIVVKTSILGEEGLAHREKLKALERYMLDFSKFKQQGVPEISIWEYYIIFAIAFGISSNVLEQISACYPDIEENNFIESYKAAKIIDKCNFKKSFLMAISSE